jgi:hypothetical protein
MTNAINTVPVDSDNLNIQDDEVTDTAKENKSNRSMGYLNGFLVFTLVGLVFSIVHAINIITSTNIVVDEATHDSITATYFQLDFLSCFISLGITFLFVVLGFVLVNKAGSSYTSTVLAIITGITTVVVGGLSVLYTFSALYYLGHSAGASVGSTEGYVPMPDKETSALLESVVGKDYGVVNFDTRVDSDFTPTADNLTYVSRDGEFYKFDKVVEGNTATWTLQKTTP